MIYLDRLEVSNFRIFPPGFSLRLEGPGVTILVGQNGLGKSSVFEAIEWVLTGKVARLEGLKSEVGLQANTRAYYARRTGRRLESNVSVMARFVGPESEAQEVSREWIRKTGDKFEVASASETQDIINLLKNPTWNLPVTDLSHYLRETHFLGQPTGGRFTTLDPKERWIRFQGPAGFERLARAGERLGPGTTRSLSALLAEAEESLASAREDQAQWLTRLHKREEYRASVGSLGALDPSTAQARLSEVVQELGKVRGSLSLPSLMPGQTAGSVEAVAQSIEQVNLDILQRVGALASISDVPEIWRQQTVRKAEVDEKLVELHARITAAEQEIAQIRNKHAEAIVVRDNARAEALRAEREFEVANRAISAAQNLTHARVDLEKALRDVQLCEDAVRSSAKSLQEKEASLNEARESERARRATLIHLKVIEAASLDFGKWQQATIRNNEYASGLERAQADIELLAGEIADAEAGLGEYSRIKRSLTSSVEDARSRDDATKRALSLIISGLDEHATACPVCMTEFDQADVLRNRALAALDADSGRHLDLQMKLNDVQRTLVELESRRDRLYERRRFAIASIEQARNFSRNVESQRQALLEFPFLQGIAEDGISAKIADELQRTQGRLSELNERMANRSSVDTLESAYATALQNHNSATERLDRVRRVASTVQGRVGELERAIAPQMDLLARMQSAHDDVAVAVQALARQLESVRDGADRAFEACDAAKNALDAKISTCELLQKQRQELEGIAVDSAQKLDILYRRWTRCGLQGVPSLDALDTANEELDRLRRSVSTINARMDHVRGAIDRWQQTRWTEQSVEDYLAEMCRRLQTTLNEPELTQRLESAVERRMERVQRVKHAKSLASTVAERIKGETEQYIRRVVAPFNAVSDRFHLALSTFPLRRVELLPRTNRRDGTSLYMGVQLRRDAAGREDGLSAPHLLSEGQLSEVAMSLLLAMSTVYRWSRWRALLMDDPLQQNDIIHAAAFIDVLRNLVLEERYQVLVSTHDLSLADFMMRKLRSGNVACAVCRFVHPGRVQTAGE
ncbi:AAA family ATPase [Sorangium sp. So ce291]|uniref:AAA family ATPase n=1 Tax=Sorangium sp. So ce291 TaxID=3133294 RepID=UPI003F607BC1